MTRNSNPMPNPSRYSQHARRALAQAQILVKRFGHPYVDTGHLLVGVMRAEGSIGCLVLHELNLYAEQAEPHLQALYPLINLRDDASASPDSLEIALELAADEAAWLSHHYIGTEHLLLGITRINSGSASALLGRMGSSPEHLRRRVRRALKDGATEFDLQTAKQVAHLSELSRRVINATEQRALVMQHPRPGVGHLLLELAREGRSPTAQLLRDAGLDEDRLERGLEAGDPLLLVGMEGLLTQVLDLVERIGSHYTGTEHLLLTLAQHPAGSAALRAYGADTDFLRRRLESA
jgi:ATP-dependent Clp protease ATP-binding subunit ClpA